MTPDFRIVHDSEDITALFRDRLLSLRVLDQAGITSDQFDLSLDNRDSAIQIPETGAVLSVAMGYKGAGLYDMGKYTIDEIESTGLPRTLSLQGKAADMKATLKSQKKRSWDKTTLGQIVQEVAAEHDLTAKVAAKFEGVPVDHLDQVYESDLNLLTRLADQHGAVMKPAGGHLLFVERGTGLAADGEPLPTATIVVTDALGGDGWRTSIQERQFYARVGAHWRNTRAAEQQYVYAGSGDPVTYLRHPYKSERDALAAAEAKLRQLQRGRTSLSLRIYGRPEICAEMPIQLTGFDALADGEWIVTRAEHSLSSGLTTRLEAQRRDDIAQAAEEQAQSQQPSE
ncbi:MAG: contractile injection system protein, VgrG/Pvc8 family [Porticoccaceae bacterium]